MNNLLRAKGIIPTDSATSLLHAEVSPIDTEEFFLRASEMLKEIDLTVRNDIISNLEQYDGRWHPSGFMVYALGLHPQLGSLRLHIWPKDLRRRLLKGREKMGEIYDGDIHNHAWNITSLTISYYRDNLYTIEEVGDKVPVEEFNQRGLFRIFNVSYLDNAQQALVTEGRCVEAKVRVQRETKSGDILNTLHTSIFHAPTIPDNRLGATLVFDSARMVIDGPDILIGGDTRPIYDTRRPVSEEDARYVKRQFQALFEQQDDQ